MSIQETQGRRSRKYVPIEVSPETRKLLAITKIKLGFRSYDELIRHLLKQAGYAD
jgi:hypothetical protein